jgi:hypothetical protein
MGNQGLLHGMILGLKNLSPGPKIETILGMGKGVGLRQGIHTLPKGTLKKKNGSKRWTGSLLVERK